MIIHNSQKFARDRGIGRQEPVKVQKVQKKSAESTHMYTIQGYHS